MEIKNCCKICLIFSGAIIVLGFAVVLMVISRRGVSVANPPEQLTESGDFFYGVHPALEARSKTVNGDSTAYLYGVPPAPPFQESEVTITNVVNELCEEATDEMVGYIIEVKENDGPDVLVMFSQGAVIIVQDEKGIRNKYIIDMSVAANAAISYLPGILIPGNKVQMKVQYCGSGGFIYVMSIKTLRRI